MFRGRETDSVMKSKLTVESDFFYLQSMSKKKIHSNGGFARKSDPLDISCEFLMFDLMITSSLQVGFSFEGEILSMDLARSSATATQPCDTPLSSPPYSNFGVKISA